MSGTAIKLSRAPQAMYFCLSVLCLFVGSALSVYYMVLREHTPAEVVSLLQGGLLFAALFWVVGVLTARRRRKVEAAIRAFGMRDR